MRTPLHRRPSPRHARPCVRPPAAAAPASPSTAAPRALPSPGLALQAVDAHVSFGNKKALRGATFAVPPGHLHILLGPNGCGKSTLLRALGGLQPLTRGVAVASPPAAFVFQNPDHQVVLPTVGADVAFGLGRYPSLSPGAVQDAVAAALDVVGCGDLTAHGVHTLSGGQKQRVAIAGALAGAPSVLLLDELTTFLDAEDAASVLAAVRAAVRARGVAALWVTHRLDELRGADGASLMDSGRVVATGEPRAVADELRRRGAVVPHW